MVADMPTIEFVEFINYALLQWRRSQVNNTAADVGVGKGTDELSERKMSVNDGWFQKEVEDKEVEEHNEASLAINNNILSDMEILRTYTAFFPYVFVAELHETKELTYAGLSPTKAVHEQLENLKRGAITLSELQRVKIREYLMNVTMERLNIKFSGLAYVNTIEVVSAPHMLIEDVSDALFSVWKKVEGMSRNSFKRMYRLNVGNTVIGPGNDTLGRAWDSNQEYLKNKEAAKSLGVVPVVFKYLEGGSPLIAPQTFDLDGSHPYLIRLHFCNIVSKSMNELYFNVYVGGKNAIDTVDLSTVTSGLSVAYYKDVFVDVSINGLEILRVNKLVNSLDGEFGAAGRPAGPSRGTVAAVGFAMMFAAFAVLGAMTVKWQKRPQPNLIGLLAKVGEGQADAHDEQCSSTGNDFLADANARANYTVTIDTRYRSNRY
ncbi:probable receptor-like protein kinase [Tanacetum coccineum]